MTSHTPVFCLAPVRSTSPLSDIFEAKDKEENNKQPSSKLNATRYKRNTNAERKVRRRYEAKTPAIIPRFADRDFNDFHNIIIVYKHIFPIIHDLFIYRKNIILIFYKYPMRFNDNCLKMMHLLSVNRQL